RQEPYQRRRRSGDRLPGPVHAVDRPPSLRAKPRIAGHLYSSPGAHGPAVRKHRRRSRSDVREPGCLRRTAVRLRPCRARFINTHEQQSTTRGVVMKKKIWLALAATAGIVTLSIAVLAVYVARTWDRVWDAPLPAIHRSTDPDVIRRGEYLVNGPAHCVLC